jgi:hypothetical protein
MALERIANILLRLAQLVFSAIVAGITGWYLHKSDEAGVSSWDMGRFIYTEIVAAISLLAALIWLVPFSSSFIHWPFDLFLSVNWFVAFGLLVDQLGDTCGYVFNWDNVAPRGDICGKLKAVMAFSFLAAICFLASALVGLLWIRRRERKIAQADAHYAHRRRWYRRSRV